MKRHVLVVLGLVIFGGALAHGQTPTAPTQEGPSPEVQKHLEAIDEDMKSFRTNWSKLQRERIRKAREEAEKADPEGSKKRVMRSMRMAPDYGPFAERLLELADDAPEADTPHYLVKAISIGGTKQGTAGYKALNRLIEVHADGPLWASLGRRIPNIVSTLRGNDQERVTKLLASHPNGDVRGWLSYAQHQRTIEEKPTDSEGFATAKRELLDALEKVEDARLRHAVLGTIERRELFAVGATAPDIEGIDLDGVAFKLSDYKGKVIFLDFWGDW